VYRAVFVRPECFSVCSRTGSRQRGRRPQFLPGTVEAMRRLTGSERLKGCRERYLVLTGRGRQELARCWLHGEQGFRVAFDLKAAAEGILRREQGAVVLPVPATARGLSTRWR
jgi:hypothetical protein